MPGTRLNDSERRLLNWWNSAAANGFLESIEVEGADGAGLRGIRSAHIKFSYPVTVISGKNGSGKSTILALCALAFHGSKASPSRNSRNGKYYTFQDFFFKGNGDPDISGVKITWNYKGSQNPLKIKKKSDKWMHYERRPSKPVHFIGISRCIPAFEQSALRSHFGSNKRQQQPQTVNNSAKKYISAILGKSYKSAETMASSKYKIRSCSSDATYTSFNMGTGEDIVIELISSLFSTPEMSLVVIEELEVGLHPSAQKELAQALPKIAKERKLQIIISSHSEYIIDNLPRESRIVIERGKKEHHIQYKPSTRSALNNLTNTTNSELLIFCEDEFAKSIIQNTIPPGLRKRADIIAAGADSELIRHLSHHDIAGHKHKTMIVWDGEVTLKKVKDWATEEKSRNPKLNLNFTRLPGSTPPEPWAICCFETSELALETLTERLKIDNTDETLDILSEARNNLNHHSLCYTIAKRLNINKDNVQTTISQVLAEHFETDLSHIPELISTIINM